MQSTGTDSSLDKHFEERVEHLRERMRRFRQEYDFIWQEQQTPTPQKSTTEKLSQSQKSMKSTSKWDAIVAQHKK